MSHGGGASEGVREKSVGRAASNKSNLFAQDLAKVSVAQICESAGFQSYQLSALETLSDVATRYLQSIAKSAQTSANGAGRSQANVFDIIHSLEEHHSSQGFASASNVHHCLATSGTLKDIAQYVSETENNPFAYTIPSFPLARERTATPSFSQIKEDPPVHIPSWLPAFPGSHKLRSDPLSEDLRKAHATCNGQEPILDKGKEPKQVNPFLMPPLPFISKASLNSRPENNESVIATDADVALPPVEKDAMIEPPREGKRRPLVQFKVAAKKANVLERESLKKVRVVKSSVEENGELV